MLEMDVIQANPTYLLRKSIIAPEDKNTFQHNRLLSPHKVSRISTTVFSLFVQLYFPKGTIAKKNNGLDPKVMHQSTKLAFVTLISLKLDQIFKAHFPCSPLKTEVARKGLLSIFFNDVQYPLFLKGLSIQRNRRIVIGMFRITKVQVILCLHFEKARTQYPYQ